MSIREEQCNKVCKILDDVLANRPTERDSLIVAVRKAFEALELFGNSEQLPSEQPEPRWIPCDKGEPDEDMECWVTVKTTDTLYRGNFTKRYGERRDKGFITSGGFMWWNTALAWMPIYEPEPYRKDGEAE